MDNSRTGMSEASAIAICAILSIIIYVIDSFIPLGVAGGVPYVLAVLASLWGPKRRLTWWVALATTILTIVGFFSSPAGGELWKVLFNRSLAVFAIWTTAILSVQRQKIQDEKNKAVSDLRILRGMLPVCASCKKIQDEKGAWSQIELYIRDHSEATFTHRLCPECGEKALAEVEAWEPKKGPE